MTLPPRSARFRITDLFVRTARPGRHADGDCLYLYVKDTGSRSWVVRAQFDGQRRDFGLGGYPQVSLAEARRRAPQIVDVIRAGGDPRADARRRSVPLVRDFVETVIEDRRPTWSCTQTEGSWRHCFATHVFPVVGDRRVSDVTLEDLRGIVGPLWGGRGSKGYILRQRLDCVMRCAIAHKHRSDNPAAELKVLLRKVKREPTYHPSLPHAEVTDAMRDVQAAGVDEALRLFVVFVVLTAARYSEAAHLSWAELNLHSALWTVPAERMKARCVHRVPLSRQALAVLDRARSLARSDSAVFVRRGPGVRLVSNHAANRLLRDLELRRRRRHARDRLRTPAHRSNSEQAARRPSQACARPRPPALRDAFEAVGRPPNRRPGAPPQRATDPGAAPLGAGATPTARARATPAAREPTRRSTRRSARARRPPSRPRP